MLPIVEAIVAAHAQGIVHRDIKPENIMVGTDDAGCIVPKVLDFGVAKLTSSPMGKPPITLGDSIVGTPEYMSPEQARGEPDVDERADVWGLSMVLHEMLAGRQPFSGSNYHSVLISILETPMPPLEGVDRGLASIVSRGLRKDRAERWGSAREFGVALAEWLIRRGRFEDITTASVRARWNLNSWRPPSDRPVSEPPAALTIQLWPEAPPDRGVVGPLDLARRILDHLAPSKGHAAAVLGSFLLLAILAILARGVSDAAPSTAAPSTPASTVTAALETPEPRQERVMDRLPGAGPPADSGADEPPTLTARSINPASTVVEKAPPAAPATTPRTVAGNPPNITINNAQFVSTISRATRTPDRKAESDEERRASGKVDFGF
jgi:serine/threonine-protein kinase